MHKKLFIPGPTEVRAEVLEAQAQPLIGHRMPEFGELNERVIKKLQQVLGTNHQVFVFTASGTGVMEAAVRNCVNLRCLCATCGAFSERWHKITKANGKEADAISVDWGKAVKPEMVEQALSTGKYDSFTLVHNETSTGVMNPISEIAQVLKRFPDVIFMVDTVSSLMGVKLDIDELGIDICLTSSQKCFALPPGIAVASVSDRAFERAKTVENRGYYFDLLEMKRYYDERRQTPTTPAITLFYALDRQLDRILEEGVENRFRRHEAMAHHTQEWARRHFSLFAEPGYESLTVTAVNNTRGIKVADLNRELGRRGFAISNGYGKLKELTFRIAHMGDLVLDELEELLKQIEDILKLG